MVATGGSDPDMTPYPSDIVAYGSNPDPDLISMDLDPDPYKWIWICYEQIQIQIESMICGSDPQIQINLADILLFDQLFLDHYLIYDPYLSENILQLLIYIRSGSMDQVQIGSSLDPDKRIWIQHWICI